MTSRHSFGQGSTWVKRANSILYALYDAKAAASKLFDREDILLQSDFFAKTTDRLTHALLAFDCKQLVSLREVGLVVKSADLDSIDNYDIVYRELIDVYEKARQLQRDIVFYNGQQEHTLEGAQRLFLNLIQSGVFIDEITHARRVLSDSQVLSNSKNDMIALMAIKREYSSSDSMMSEIDEKMVGLDAIELQDLNTEVDRFLVSPEITLADLPILENLMVKVSPVSTAIRNYGKLDDVRRGVSWLLDLATRLDCEGNSLQATSDKVLSRLPYLGVDGVRQYYDWLAGCQTITYSVHPITAPMQSAKALFWDVDASRILKEGELSKEKLQKLIKNMPQFMVQVPAHLAIVKELIRQVEATEHKFHMIKSTIEGLIKDDIEANLLQILEIADKLSSLSCFVSEDSQLKRFKEFEPLKEQIADLEVLLKIYRMMTKLNATEEHKSDKTPLNDFINLYEISLEEKYSAFHQTNLFLRMEDFFNKIKESRTYLAHFGSRINKEPHKPVALYEPSFMNHMRDLSKMEVVLGHQAKLERYFFLGDLGFGVKGFLKKYRTIEQNLISLAEYHPVSCLLTYSSDDIQSLQREFQQAKSELQVKIYSPKLEDLAVFEWTLKAVELLKVKGVKLDDLSKHCQRASELKYRDKDLWTELNDRLGHAQSLKQGLEDLLKEGCKPLHKILSMRDTLNNSPVELASLKRRVATRINDAKWIAEGFEEIEGRLRDKKPITMEELQALLVEIKDAQLEMPEIEDKVKHYLDVCDNFRSRLLNLIENCSVRVEKDITPLLKEYETIGFTIREVDTLVKKRNDAMRKLQLVKPGDLEYKNLKQLGETENLLKESLDIQKNKEMFAMVVYLRSKKTVENMSPNMESFSGEDTIKREDLFTLMDKLGFLVHEDDIPLLSTQQIISVGGFKDKVDNSLSNFKKQFEKSGSLQAVGKHFYKFVDYTSDVKKVVEEIVEQRKAHRSNMKPDPMKNGVLDVAIEDDVLLKEQFREHRKAAIRQFKVKLAELLKSEDPVVILEQAKFIDESIYSRTKSSLTAYDQMVPLYQRFLDMFHNNRFLCELVIEKNYDPRLLELMIGAKKGEGYIANNEHSARAFIRQSQIEVCLRSNKEQDLILCLGKRTRQPHFKDYMDWVFRKNQQENQCSTPVKRPFSQQEAEFRQRSGGNSDQKRLGSGKKTIPGKTKGQPADLAVRYEAQITDLEKQIARANSNSGAKRRLKRLPEVFEEEFGASRASRDRDLKPEAMLLEPLDRSDAGDLSVRAKEVSGKGRKEKEPEIRHVIEPREIWTNRVYEVAYYPVEPVPTSVHSEGVQHEIAEACSPIQDSQVHRGSTILALKLPTVVIKRQVSGHSALHFDSEGDKTTQEDGQTGHGGQEADQTLKQLPKVGIDEHLIGSREGERQHIAWLSVAKDEEEAPCQRMNEEPLTQEPQEPRVHSTSAHQPGQTASTDLPGVINVAQAAAYLQESGGSALGIHTIDHDIIVPMACRREAARETEAGHDLYEKLGNKTHTEINQNKFDESENDQEETRELQGGDNHEENEGLSKTAQKHKTSSKKMKGSKKGRKTSVKEIEKVDNTDVITGLLEEAIREKEGQTSANKNQQEVRTLEEWDKAAHCDHEAAPAELAGQTDLRITRQHFMRLRNMDSQKDFKTPSPPQTASRRQLRRDPTSSKQPSHLTQAKDLRSSDKKKSWLGKRQLHVEDSPPALKVNSAFKTLGGVAGMVSKFGNAKGAPYSAGPREKAEEQQKQHQDQALSKRNKPREEVYPLKLHAQLSRTERKKEMLPALLQKKGADTAKDPKDKSDSKLSHFNKGSKRLKREDDAELKGAISKDKVAPSAKKSTKDKSSSPLGMNEEIQKPSSQVQTKQEEPQGSGKMQNELDYLDKQPKEMSGHSQLVLKKIKSKDSDVFMQKGQPIIKKKTGQSGNNQNLSQSFVPRNMCHGPDSASSKTETISAMDQEEFKEVTCFEDFKKLKQRIKKEYTQKKKTTKRELNLTKIGLKSKDKVGRKVDTTPDNLKSPLPPSKTDKSQSIHQHVEAKSQIPKVNSWVIYDDLIRFSILDNREAQLKLVSFTEYQTIKKAADFGHETLDINRIFGTGEFHELITALSHKIKSGEILKIGGFLLADETESILGDVIRSNPGGSGRVFWSTIKESMEIFLIKPKDIPANIRVYFDCFETPEMQNAEFCFLMLQEADLYTEYRRMRPIAFEKNAPEQINGTTKPPFKPGQEGKSDIKLLTEGAPRQDNPNSVLWKVKETNDLLNFEAGGRKGSLNELEEYHLEHILEKEKQKAQYKYSSGKTKGKAYQPQLSNSMDRHDRQSCCSSLVDFKH